MDAKNLVVLVGRLTSDPELRITPSGDPVVNFAIAVNRSIRKKDGAWEDLLDGYFDCEHFGDAAERFATDFKKGATVQVVGSLHQRKYEVGNGAGTRKVSKVQVRAKTVAPVLVAPKPRREESTTQQESSPVAEPQPA